MTDKEKIIKYLDFKGVSKNKFYTKTGLSVGFLDSGNSLGVDKLRIIIDNYPDLNESWLIFGYGNMIKSQQEYNSSNETSSILSEPKPTYGSKAKPLLPIEAFAGSGGGRFQINEHDIKYRYEIPEFSSADFYMRVKGNSMAPKYCAGDVLACQNIKESAFFQWNRVYVMDTDNGALVKRIKQGSDDDHLILVSENPEYEPFVIPKSEVHAYAIVLGKIVTE